MGDVGVASRTAAGDLDDRQEPCAPAGSHRAEMGRRRLLCRGSREREGCAGAQQRGRALQERATGKGAGYWRVVSRISSAGGVGAAEDGARGLDAMGSAAADSGPVGRMRAARARAAVRLSRRAASAVAVDGCVVVDDGRAHGLAGATGPIGLTPARKGPFDTGWLAGNLSRPPQHHALLTARITPPTRCTLLKLLSTALHWFDSCCCAMIWTRHLSQARHDGGDEQCENYHLAR